MSRELSKTELANLQSTVESQLLPGEEVVKIFTVQWTLKALLRRFAVLFPILAAGAFILFPFGTFLRYGHWELPNPIALCAALVTVYLIVVLRVLMSKVAYAVTNKRLFLLGVSNKLSATSIQPMSFEGLASIEITGREDARGDLKLRFAQKPTGMFTNTLTIYRVPQPDEVKAKIKILQLGHKDTMA